MRRNLFCLYKAHITLGYDPDYIEDILEEKKQKRDALTRRISKREAEMALDLRRPTYIRVRKIHLHPDTLDYYRLPWEYDPVSLHADPNDSKTDDCNRMTQTTY